MRYSYVAATLVGSALAMPQYGYSAVVPTGYQPAPTSSKPYEASTPSAYHASTPASSKVYEASTPSSQVHYPASTPVYEASTPPAYSASTPAASSSVYHASTPAARWAGD